MWNAWKQFESARGRGAVAGRTETQVLSPAVLSPPLLVNTIIAQVLQHRNIFAVDVIFVAFGIRISLSEEIGMQQFDILE